MAVAMWSRADLKVSFGHLKAHWLLRPSVYSLFAVISLR